MHDNAKERRRPAHGLVVLLGQQHRRLVHRPLGEQDHVLHSLRVRPRPVIVRRLTSVCARRHYGACDGYIIVYVPIRKNLRMDGAFDGRSFLRKGERDGWIVREGSAFNYICLDVFITEKLIEHLH